MILNERILRLVVILAEELHFGRAAARLYVSQSALSGSLKSLERDLGARLFQRTSRNVALTEAGNVLVAEARRLIKEAERAVALVRGCSSHIPGPLLVGYPASMNLHWLGELISQARRNKFLGSDIQFISSEAAGLYEELAKGRLHAAFLTESLAHRDLPDLHRVSLFREAFAVVLRHGHALAGDTTLLIDQLEDEPVVWLRRDVNLLLHDAFMAMCSSQGYRPKVVQEARTFYECLQFARDGVGITFLPAFMKADEGDEVVFVRLPEGTLDIEYALAYCRNGAPDSINRFVELVQAHAPNANPAF